MHSCWEGFDKLINLSFHLRISTAQIISPYMPDYFLLQHQQDTVTNYPSHQTQSLCFPRIKDKKCGEEYYGDWKVLVTKRMFSLTGSIVAVLSTRTEGTEVSVYSLINLFFVCLQYSRPSKDVSIRDFCVWIYGVILWIIISYCCLRVIVMSTMHQAWLWYASLIYQLYVPGTPIDETVTEKNRTNWDVDIHSQLII